MHLESLQRFCHIMELHYILVDFFFFKFIVELFILMKTLL